MNDRRPKDPMTTFHVDDEFHPPTSDDPSWTETCWYTFAIPDRLISGQIYPFFLPNLNVVAAGVYLWDAHGDSMWDALYAKNLWHVPLPDAPLTDISLANGISYKCLESMHQYKIDFRDPDADDVAIDLLFTSVARANKAGKHHLDQPGRYTGTIRLGTETIEVDSYGFRDRSWGLRSQIGPNQFHNGAPYGAYSYATASERDGFHTITWDRGNGCESVHGYLLRDGEWAKLARAEREVLERDGQTGCPTEVRIVGEDELGRTLEALGSCKNRIGFPINPNLHTWNCLTEWRFDGCTAWGEDHDNWSAREARRFFRGRRGVGTPRVEVAGG